MLYYLISGVLIMPKGVGVPDKRYTQEFAWLTTVVLPDTLIPEELFILYKNLLMMRIFSACHSNVNQILYTVIFQKVYKLWSWPSINKRTIHRKVFVCHGLTILSIENRLFVAGKNSLQTGVRYMITQYQMPLFATFCRTLRILKIMPSWYFTCIVF